MRLAEAPRRGEFDDGLDLALERHRQHDHRRRAATAEGRSDPQIVGRDVGQKDRLSVLRALPHQALADTQRLRQARRVARVAGEQFQPPLLAAARLHIEHALVGVDQRRQL
jgi:hypothetical protein